MHEQRFDALARALGSASSRREVLKMLLGGALGGVGVLLGRRQAAAIESPPCKSSATGPLAPCFDAADCHVPGTTGVGLNGRCGVISPSVCGCVPVATCVPASSCPAGDNCGTVPDGCGGTLSCGTCAAPQTCGGGGTANVCGCTPLTSCPAGQTCGTAPDGCGGLLGCGPCAGVSSCSATPAVLSPADGTLRAVSLSFSVTGSTPATVTLLSVTSNQPITAADTPRFAAGNTYLVSPPGTGTATGQVRATVTPGGHARQYVFTFAVVTGGQQGSPCQATVQVRLR